MLTAEEMEVTSANYGTQNLSNPSYNRLLNSTLGLGTEANPLPATWMQNVLMHVGNYYEAYDLEHSVTEWAQWPTVWLTVQEQ